MRKCYCDSCQKETERYHEFNVPYHVYRAAGFSLSVYADPDGNATSGRMVTLDLCQACYNTAHTAAFATVLKANPALKEK